MTTPRWGHLATITSIGFAMVPKCPACLLAGLDEALELVARIAAYDVAVQVQQVTQYFPDPPIRGQLPKPGPCPLAARLSLSKRRKDG